MPYAYMYTYQHKEKAKYDFNLTRVEKQMFYSVQSKIVCACVKYNDFFWSQIPCLFISQDEAMLNIMIMTKS